MKNCDTDAEVQKTLAMDETMDLVLATGFPKPLQMLRVGDVQEVIQMLLQYHLFAKVKAEMDQFTDGLKALGFLDLLRQNPPLWEEYFVATETVLSPGLF